jgi:hypothetical protein
MIKSANLTLVILCNGLIQSEQGECQFDGTVDGMWKAFRRIQTDAQKSIFDQGKLT